MGWRATGLGTMLWLVCVGAVAACAAPGSGGGLDTVGSPVARYDWDPASGRDEALMEGVLELRGGCLYIVGTGDAEGLTTVPVLPRALASWDSSSETLVYAGVEFAAGDEVAAGGGWGPPTADMTIPDACEPDEWGEVMHVQDQSLAPMDHR